jgi:hypothetical protein
MHALDWPVHNFANASVMTKRFVVSAICVGIVPMLVIFVVGSIGGLGMRFRLTLSPILGGFGILPSVFPILGFMVLETLAAKFNKLIELSVIIGINHM